MPQGVAISHKPMDRYRARASQLHQSSHLHCNTFHDDSCSPEPPVTSFDYEFLLHVTDPFERMNIWAKTRMVYRLISSILDALLLGHLVILHRLERIVRLCVRKLRNALDRLADLELYISSLRSSLVLAWSYSDHASVHESHGSQRYSCLTATRMAKPSRV